MLWEMATALDSLSDAVSVLRSVRDPLGRTEDFEWTFANEAACVAAGCGPGELAGRRLLERTPDPERFERLRTVVETGAPWHASFAGADRRAFELAASRIDEHSVVVVVRDVTVLHAQAEALARRNAELELLTHLADLLRGCLSTEEAYAVVARSCERLFPGVGGAFSILRTSPERYQTVRSWGDVPPGESVFASSECWGLRLGRPHLSDDGEPRCRHLVHPSQEGAPARSCLCVPLLGRGQELGVLHLFPVAGAGLDAPARQLAKTVSCQISISIANLRLRDELRDLSVRDPVTGLFHKRYLEETLTRELARITWSGAPLGLVQIEVDHFATYNDQHGHDAGDAVLQAVAEVLLRSSRPSDVACRYGAEQFTLLLPDAPPGVVASRAEELRCRIEDLRIRHRGQKLPGITISCGVATAPENAIEGEPLLRAAHEALREAERCGRNAVIRASARAR
jgi:diguanylate cyclase (GGDEF)-like protein